MSATTTIQWTDKTWNPVRGCSIVSPGCVNCYAMKQAHRFSGEGKPYHGLTKQTKAGPQWTGVVRTVERALLEPLSWRKPARVFVNSMSDLFHEGVPDEFIDCVFNVMAYSPQHAFQVLTKRPERMLRYLATSGREERALDGLYNAQFAERHGRAADELICRGMDRVEQLWPDGQPTFEIPWPLPNVWLGVSCENQEQADKRIPLLLQTPAAVRFVSAEPLLSGIDIAKHRPGALGLHWLIVGGESGPGARVCRPWWIRNLIGQCRDAGVAPFVKQFGSHVVTRNDDGWEGDTPRSWPMDTDFDEHINGFREDFQGADVRVRLRDRKGGDIAEWPEDLRIREFPR